MYNVMRLFKIIIELLIIEIETNEKIVKQFVFAVCQPHADKYFIYNSLQSTLI